MSECNVNKESRNLTRLGLKRIVAPPLSYCSFPPGDSLHLSLSLAWPWAPPPAPQIKCFLSNWLLHAAEERATSAALGQKYLGGPAMRRLSLLIRKSWQCSTKPPLPPHPTQSSSSSALDRHQKMTPLHAEVSEASPKSCCADSLMSFVVFEKCANDARWEVPTAFSRRHLCSPLTSNTLFILRPTHSRLLNVLRVKHGGVTRLRWEKM